jgi:hypothetical protein
LSSFSINSPFLHISCKSSFSFAINSFSPLRREERKEKSYNWVRDRRIVWLCGLCVKTKY